MPRQTAGPRLYWHRARALYYVRDGRQYIGAGTRDRKEAERKLAAYIATKHRPVAGPCDPSQVTVSEILTIYGDERGPLVKDRARMGDCIVALASILGELPLSAISGEICRRYGKTRNRAPGTVRKELGTLAAAINHCHAEGYITAAPRVRLPAKPPPRDRALERWEAGRLLRAAYRNPKAKHLARFVLVGLYTGTRTDAILRLQFFPNTAGGWVDTQKGVLYRRGTGEAETKKRTPPIQIPRPLLAHLRRWERQGARYVVEVDGQRVASLKTAWRTALATSGIDHCTKHDLRHTAITWAMRNGADRWHAAGFFGLTVDMLESVYGHHHPDHMRSAVEAMERKSFV